MEGACMVISLNFQNALHAIDVREIGSIAGKHKNVLPLRTHESGNLRRRHCGFDSLKCKIGTGERGTRRAPLVFVARGITMIVGRERVFVLAQGTIERQRNLQRWRQSG